MSSKLRKPQVTPGNNNFRSFKLIHQSLSINDVNFRKQVLTVSASQLTTIEILCPLNYFRQIKCFSCRNFM